MHILIAPNAFKNSLDAAQVALAIEEGLKQSRLDCTTECFPIADGGDGTGGLIVERCKGKTVKQSVRDPLGREIASSFGLIGDGKAAVIEMADASGLRLLKKEQLDPMWASSYGTGELIKAALDKTVKRIIIAMGGSATVDGGCGILSALGIKFLDDAGRELIARPKELAKMARIDASGIDDRILNCEVVILCDVDNTLLGTQGAAAVFGPQKGATPGEVELLDSFLANFAAISKTQTGTDMVAIKHGGVAGGATAGLYTWLNAKLVNGIEYFLELIGFDEALKRSDLVITGEGSIDRQTLQGKGPYGVAVKAKALNLPVVALAGNVSAEGDEELKRYFDELICINEEGFDIAEAIKNTRGNLIRSAISVGNSIASKII
ncbi:glycerate kinase [Mucilaginibacter ginsenosidivorans]|uniref:Glycerate kinase n=1 Tax=Mucilaginibacter ginsenosidivorans TaxID=398053 RepID=A0A5B8URQ7_9SPHI|nr:glycerate kinase [Mucilaginibacter ginsenosidivorans]QEC61639.1 glycerate kinase [Mucilaginibacter ginsenosidivorans]